MSGAVTGHLTTYVLKTETLQKNNNNEKFANILNHFFLRLAQTAARRGGLRIQVTGLGVEKLIVNLESRQTSLAFTMQYTPSYDHKPSYSNFTDYCCINQSTNPLPYNSSHRTK